MLQLSSLRTHWVPTLLLVLLLLPLLLRSLQLQPYLLSVLGCWSGVRYARCLHVREPAPRHRGWD